MTNAELLSHGIIVVKLPEDQERKIPAGWGIRDVVLGCYRGKAILFTELADLESAAAWVRRTTLAFRTPKKRDATREATAYVKETNPPKMERQEVRFWRNLKPWSAFPRRRTLDEIRCPGA